jgi:ABC-type transport system involved in multi-copper enzyme maturation permease subunit
MNNIFIITWFTLREAFSRKVFLFFFAISTFLLLLLFISSTGNVKIFIGTNSSGSNFSSDFFVSKLELGMISILAWWCIILSIFSTSSFIPIMLEKGNIDLLLSKPVSREQLLLGKYFGGLLVVFLNIAYIVLGIWRIISIKFAMWNFAFLWAIVFFTFSFGILYSIIILSGVITKSSILGMMLAFLVYTILSPAVYFLYNNLDLIGVSNSIKILVKIFYYIIPQTSVIDNYLLNNLVLGLPVVSYQPIYVSLGFIILTMGIALSIFKKKDF